MDGPFKKNSPTDLLGGSLNPDSISELDSSHLFRPSTSSSRVKQIWAIGGGKGGVGKSLISSSVAISLARLGNRVCAIDLDLGGANLHTTLGVDLPRVSLSDFFANRVHSLRDCSVPTTIPNLTLISGAQDNTNVANIREQNKVQLLKTVRDLDADFLIFDLGAGTSLNTLDFFLFADVQFITILPEPTSIENAYRFIKAAYYRRLSMVPSLAPIRDTVFAAMDHKNSMGIKSPSDLFTCVSRDRPDLAPALKNEIEKFRPRLILNQARTQADIELGFSVKTICKKYFGIDMDYVGHLDYDSAVWQAVRRKKPLMIEFPNSKLVSSIDRIVRQMFKRYAYQANQSV